MVPGYPDFIPLCFTHEREYADRYGPSDIRPILHTRLDNADSVKADSQFATTIPAKENEDV